MGDIIQFPKSRRTGVIPTYTLAYPDGTELKAVREEDATFALGMRVEQFRELGLEPIHADLYLIDDVAGALRQRTA